MHMRDTQKYANTHVFNKRTKQLFLEYNRNRKINFNTMNEIKVSLVFQSLWQDSTQVRPQKWNEENLLYAWARKVLN